MKYIAKNLNDTKKLAKALSEVIDNSGYLVCLYGDIGSGKTTFTKALAEYLGITQKVTSPSFVILNEYHADGLIMYHFDLYRLEQEGVDTIIDELSEYSEKENSITMVEWAEFSSDSLPDERLEIKINYIDDEEREFSFQAFGKKNELIINKLKNLV